MMFQTTKLIWNTVPVPSPIKTFLQKINMKNNVIGSPVYVCIYLICNVKKLERENATHKVIDAAHFTINTQYKSILLTTHPRGN